MLSIRKFALVCLVYERFRSCIAKIITEVRGDENTYFEENEERPKNGEVFFAGVISIDTDHAKYF